MSRQDKIEWAIVVFTLLVTILALSFLGCAAKGYERRDKREQHQDTDQSAGDYSMLTSISVESGALGGVAGLGILGWLYTGWDRRRERQALKRVCEAVETADASNVKAHVRAMGGTERDSDPIERRIHRRVKQLG